MYDKHILQDILQNWIDYRVVNVESFMILHVGPIWIKLNDLMYK